MTNPFRRRPPKPQQVKLDVVNAVELKTDANYILVADSRHVSRADMDEIMKQCRKVGVTNVVGFLLQGGPGSAVQVVDRPKPVKQRDKSGKFIKKGNKV